MINRYTTNHVGRSICKEDTDYVCGNLLVSTTLISSLPEGATVGYTAKTGPECWEDVLGQEFCNSSW